MKLLILTLHIMAREVLIFHQFIHKLKPMPIEYALAPGAAILG
jgi:hypothetical protein